MGTIQVFGLLIGVSTGLFLFITALVVLPGRIRARFPWSGAAGAVWFGGPFRSERKVNASEPVLVGWSVSERRSEVDWVALAELSEPGRRVGGASVRW